MLLAATGEIDRRVLREKKRIGRRLRDYMYNVNPMGHDNQVIGPAPVWMIVES
jgi:hypothetical protein